MESKGILRTGTEEFALASEAHETDKVAAEFIRTFREEAFHGRLFLERVEAIAAKSTTVDVRTVLPSSKKPNIGLDLVSLYGFRPPDASLWYLSPFEFTQWCFGHKLRAPTRTYTLTVLTDNGRAKRKEGDNNLIVGEDYVANETVVSVCLIGSFRITARFNNVIRQHA